MFYLGGTTFPTTREQLVSAVTEGLRQVFTLPDRSIVTIEGGNYPPFDRVAVDLTGARIDADSLPPDPRGTGQRQPGAFTAKLEVGAHPMYVRQAAVDLSLSAADALFDYDRDARGRPVLQLNQAKDGRVTIQITKQDLDALVLATARTAASAQGVQIVEAQTTLTQIDARTAAADVRVKAKKMFLTATVELHGKLTVDDALNARLFDLSCSGKDMLSEFATAAIRPHLKKIDGTTFPLAGMGQLRLRDVAMELGNSIKVTAAFGS